MIKTRILDRPSCATGRLICNTVFALNWEESNYEQDMKFAVMGFVMSILGATKGAAGAGEVLAPNWVRLAFRALDSLETDELRLNDFSHSM